MMYDREPVRVYTHHMTRFYTFDLKPMSLNDAYLTQQGRPKTPFKKSPWKNKTWRRKTDEADHYQYEIKEGLAYQDLVKYEGSKLSKPSAAHGIGVRLTLVFYIPASELRTVDLSNYKGRDVSNYVKLIEDAVFEYLGFDDSYNLEPHPYKRLSPDGKWHIVLALGHCSLDAPVEGVDASCLLTM